MSLQIIEVFPIHFFIEALSLKISKRGLIIMWHKCGIIVLCLHSCFREYKHNSRIQKPFAYHGSFLLPHPSHTSNSFLYICLLLFIKSTPMHTAFDQGTISRLEDYSNLTLESLLRSHHLPLYIANRVIFLKFKSN